MRFVLQADSQNLISISSDELTHVLNALNEVCNGVHIPDSEFETRLGASRLEISALFSSLQAQPSNEAKSFERTAAWADQHSVQAICVSVHGDPVDMNAEEAGAFIESLQEAAKQAGDG